MNLILTNAEWAYLQSYIDAKGRPRKPGEKSPHGRSTVLSDDSGIYDADYVTISESSESPRHSNREQPGPFYGSCVFAWATSPDDEGGLKPHSHQDARKLIDLLGFGFKLSNEVLIHRGITKGVDTWLHALRFQRVGFPVLNWWRDIVPCLQTADYYGCEVTGSASGYITFQFDL